MNSRVSHASLDWCVVWLFGMFPPEKLKIDFDNETEQGTGLIQSFLCFSDNTQNNGDSMLFEFNMGALTGLLRRQAEQNPSASYFNVDILKYQVNTHYTAIL